MFNNSGLNAKDAINNAENWGYYFVSHYKILQARLASDMMPILFGYTDFTRLEDSDLQTLDAYLENRPDFPPEMRVSFGAGPKYDDDTYVAEITDR